MKNLKKLASVALALVMAMALMAPAFAQDVNVTPSSPDNASVTVENASKGETYVLYKLFDATYNTTTQTIVYTYEGTAGENWPLKDYFTVDAQGYVTATDAAKDGDYLSADAVTAIKNNIQTLGTQIASQESNGDANLVFKGLEYGYYVVISRSENSAGGAISVTSTNPNGTLKDKNGGNDPHFPEDGTGKVVTTATGNKVAHVGETVTYTIKYVTVNWIDKNNDGIAETQVDSYTIHDTLPEFLDNVNVISIKVGDTSIATQQFTNNEITVAWTENGQSKYDNGAVLEITYEAVVNEKVLGVGDENHKNEVTAWPNGENQNPDKEDENVYTATVVIDKYEEGNESTKLAGAKFVLKNGNGEYYKYVAGVAEDNPATTDVDERIDHVVWVSNKDDATEVETDSNGAASFPGLATGTYYLEETEAPAGYNKIADDESVIVTVTGNATANVSQDVDVPNSTGAVLPSTGGMGTTIFYAVGGVLLVGSAILFVTKKRMGE